MLLGGFGVMVPAQLLADTGLITQATVDILLDTLVMFAFPLLWLYEKGRRQKAELSAFYRKPAPFPWKLVAVATVIVMLFSTGISIVQFHILSYLIPEEWLGLLADPGVMDESSAAMAVFSAISVCVFAPIMEETIFRGFFLQRMTHKWGVKRGVVFSSVLFGLGHADVIGATVFGLLMCLLYVKTKSLLPGMAVHALNNAIVSALLLGGGSSGAGEEISRADFQSTTELAIAIALLVVSLLWLVPFFRKQWRFMKDQGLPLIPSAYAEAAAGVYSQVVITERHMAVELPDEVVQQLGLEEEDYVHLEVEDGRVIVTKARGRIS
nr:CPBP family intramembrane glutamic endopeptidase [Ectobacillus ponti]